MQSIESNGLDLSKKKVLIRLDLNVPIFKNKITDTNRIDKIIPSLRFLIDKKAKIIILSHVGRPKGKIVKELSLSPVREDLINKLNTEINLITTNLKDLNPNNIDKSFNQKIVMFENLRFYKEEEENNLNFAKHLASFGDIYVNEAFSCSHRKHASVYGITKFIPSYAGLQLNAEINALRKLTKDIKKPITCIIGGSKISTKINVIKNLIPKFDYLIFVGGMANNILKYNKYNIGKSISELNCDKLIDEIFSLSKNNNCKIIYPKDVLIGKNLEDKPQTKNVNELTNNDLILDIGPKTIEEVKNVLKNSKSVLWNGPAGFYENPDFSKGSFEIAKQIVDMNSNNKIYSVAGGGDTVAAINSFGLGKYFNFISTAGGAFLEFLEGKELPGIKALD